MRKIFHCDCNSFFASVELLPYPQLQQKPVAVAGNKETRHGIILAKNEVAKKYGVKTAETIESAKRKCPDLVILPPHREKYHYFSNIINEIYNNYTDLVEPFGIDESWLDVTHSYHLFAKDEVALAQQLKERVYYETGLTISIGVSFNKIFAKLGSDYKKPNAITVITAENYTHILHPLSVENMMYVGATTKNILNAMGIHTIGQLAQTEQSVLMQKLGKQGADLYQFANGLEQSPVLSYNAKREHKSIGSGNTFYRNIKEIADIKPALTVLSDEVGMRLRGHGLYANGIQITIKNPQFHSVTRQCKVASTNLSKRIYETAFKLVMENWQSGQEIRALTVTALDLSEEKRAQQTSLFVQNEIQCDEKQENLQKTLDDLRQKFGDKAVKSGSVIKTDLFG